MAILPKLIYSFNAVKIPTDFVLAVIDKLTLHYTRKYKKPRRVKPVLEKKNMNDFGVFNYTF
jgi:hypothetical protein